MAPPKTSWADDVDDLDAPPRIEETIDENGIRTIVEYTTNEDGKRVKITRRIKRTLVKTAVEPAVAERKAWAKFGVDKGKPPGPDRATTTVGEKVPLKLSAGGHKAEAEPEPESDMKKQLAGRTVTCRLCKGAHFTTKCPYRDTLGALGVDGTDAPDGDGLATPQNEPAAASSMGAGGSAGGKYVPPSMRAGAGRGAGEMMGRGPGGMNRDDMPTLRVTNVSEDTDENDLRDLFSRFGRVARVFIGKDRDTGIGKGYAFVSFEDRTTAEKAMNKTNGIGYDNLILSVQWSQPREPRP